MNSFDFIVVGDGFASNSFTYLLGGGPSVLKISAPSVFPVASLVAGGVISSYQAVRGTSPLGDLLLDSFEAFVHFYQKEKPPGVFPLEEDLGYFVSPRTYLKFLSRGGKAYPGVVTHFVQKKKGGRSFSFGGRVLFWAQAFFGGRVWGPLFGTAGNEGLRGLSHPPGGLRGNTVDGTLP